jgi:2-dehydro-3-deoxygluconokinase
VDVQNGNQERRWDVAAVGETMVAFVPCSDRDRFRRTYVGAESNVTIAMRNAGARSCWVSRVGDDDAGRYLLDSIRSHGVDLYVEVDEHRPTGICIKEFRDDGTTVRYYRAGSAASQLNSEALPDLANASMLHVTGITPALSSAAAEAVSAAMQRARNVGTLVSYDLNLRPRLWPDLATARRRLLALVPLADVVFVGEDESRAIDAGTDGRTFATMAGLRDDSTLVFKRGAVGAELWHSASAEPLFEPAERDIEVVDVTGAGDAFAAGFLLATLRDAPPRTRLRLGHLMAARAVAETGDIGTPLAAEVIDGLLAAQASDRLPPP